MAADATMLIGHCRYATHGSPSENSNNHPHVMKDGFVVHNGMIHNYQDLILEFGLRTHTECDSEVLGLLIDKLRGKSLLSRVAKTAELARSKSPFAMLTLTKTSLCAVRSNDQPLHWGETPRGYYLASLPDALPGEPRTIPQNEVLLYGSAA